MKKQYTVFLIIRLSLLAVSISEARGKATKLVDDQRQVVFRTKVVEECKVTLPFTVALNAVKDIIHGEIMNLRVDNSSEAIRPYPIGGKEEKKEEMTLKTYISSLERCFFEAQRIFTSNIAYTVEVTLTMSVLADNEKESLELARKELEKSGCEVLEASIFETIG